MVFGADAFFLGLMKGLSNRCQCRNYYTKVCEHAVDVKVTEGKEQKCKMVYKDVCTDSKVQDCKTVYKQEVSYKKEKKCHTE